MAALAVAAVASLSLVLVPASGENTDWHWRWRWWDIYDALYKDLANIRAAWDTATPLATALDDIKAEIEALGAVNLDPVIAVLENIEDLLGQGLRGEVSKVSVVLTANVEETLFTYRLGSADITLSAKKISVWLDTWDLATHANVVVKVYYDSDCDGGEPLYDVVDLRKSFNIDPQNDYLVVDQLPVICGFKVTVESDKVEITLDTVRATVIIEEN